MALEIYTQNFG